MSRLPSVTFDGQYFIANGRRFLPIGAHWVPARAALQWPLQWDEAAIEADFAKMSDLGFNVVRLDLFWAWFEPRPGYYHPRAFQQFDFFLELAHRHRIYLHPTLFIGNEVGEAYWDVPWRNGRHPHADPAMLRLQTEHAAEFARRYRDETAILAWDLTDEPPFWIVADDTSDDMAVNWTRLIAGAIRRYDPNHPICVGTDVQDLTHGPFRPDLIAQEVDFFTVHPYPIYLPNLFPDALLSSRATYAAAFQTILSSGAGKSTMIHELGASSAQYDPERIARYDRVAMYSALAAGANGFIPWCFTDAAPETYHRVPYRRAPHETQFGLTTWEGEDRPAGAMLRQFGQLLARLNLDGVAPAPAEAALIIPHEWAKPHGDFSRSGRTGPEIIPYVSVQDAWRDEEEAANDWLMGALLSAFILARRAGLGVAMPREYAHWRQHPLLLTPSPLTSTEINLVHVHTTFWQDVRQYVAEGGSLYASLCADAAIPNMEALFGARLVDHAPPADEVRITFITDFGDIPAGRTLSYRANPANLRHWPALLDAGSAQVVAVDAAGRPALAAQAMGRGKTLLSAYPLEHYLAVTPAAFDGEENTHLLYRALRQWAGVQPLFVSDTPAVEVGALTGEGRAYVIMVNHSANAQKVTVRARQPIASVTHLTPTGDHPLPHQGNSWQIQVSPHHASILEVML